MITPEISAKASSDSTSMTSSLISLGRRPDVLTESSIAGDMIISLRIGILTVQGTSAPSGNRPTTVTFGESSTYDSAGESNRPLYEKVSMSHIRSSMIVERVTTRVAIMSKLLGIVVEETEVCCKFDSWVVDLMDFEFVLMSFAESRKKSLYTYFMRPQSVRVMTIKCIHTSRCYCLFLATDKKLCVYGFEI